MTQDTGLQLGLQLIRESRNIKAACMEFLSPLVQAEKLTHLQLFVLTGIAEGEVDNINSLCRWLDIGQGNASTLCKRLEEEGFLHRSRSRMDERIVLLRLTERGRAAVSHIQAELAACCKYLLASRPEQMQAVLDGLRTANGLLAVLAERRAGSITADAADDGDDDRMKEEQV